MSNLIKIHSVGAELIHADGQTDAQTDGRTDRWKDRRTDGRTDRQRTEKWIDMKKLIRF